MAWNQPGNSNNNPWGKKPASGGDLDQAFKEWQKRIESLFGGGGGGAGGGSSTPILIIIINAIGAWRSTGLYQVKTGERGVVQRFCKHDDTVGANHSNQGRQQIKGLESRDGRSRSRD